MTTETTAATADALWPEPEQAQVPPIAFTTERAPLTVASVEGFVRYRRSSTDEPKVCVCCPGEPSHVFACSIEVSDGTPERGPDGSLFGTGGGWVARAIRRLPDGTPVRLSLAALDPVA